MKAAESWATNLHALLKQHRSSYPEQPEIRKPVDVLVYSFLLWERTSPQANAAYQAVRASFIDYNEFRVSLPYEIAAHFPGRDQRAEERARRLRAVLNHIYRLENAVTLESLQEVGKRDARKYLDSLEGMTPYVAARVGLLCFDAHAIPIDKLLHKTLVAHNALDKSLNLSDAGAWLARQIKATNAQLAHSALQSAVDAKSTRGPSSITKTTADSTRSRKDSSNLRSTTASDAHAETKSVTEAGSPAAKREP